MFRVVVVMENIDAARPEYRLRILADLPVRRREALLWRFALELDYDGVDAMFREQSVKPCGWQGAAHSARADGGAR